MLQRISTIIKTVQHLANWNQQRTKFNSNKIQIYQKMLETDKQWKLINKVRIREPNIQDL